MEERLNRAMAGLKNLEAALDGFSSVREDIEVLSAYYTGGQWRRDFEEDEAGRFPADLPRGVLSEDALYDLLQEYDELKNRVNKPESDV